MAIEFFIEPVPVLGHAIKKSFELSKVDVDLFGKRCDPNSLSKEEPSPASIFSPIPSSNFYLKSF
ncbi:hypothetical protein LEP1GSC162_0520 [Leptospira santarosai str. CBC1531]|nr:hypothetical protein LEP1GSC162_0520 [Leptospira santarosai str. CBC1531]